MTSQPEHLAASPLDSLLGFNGERTDPMVGNYHLGNGYRMYNPALRRFTAPDDMSPFGAGGINPYAYCAGDPINNTDPTGHVREGVFLSLVETTVELVAPEAAGAEAAEGSSIAVNKAAASSKRTAPEEPGSRRTKDKKRKLSPQALTVDYHPRQADIGDWNRKRYDFLSNASDQKKIPITILSPSTSSDPFPTPFDGKLDFAMVRRESGASSEYVATQSGQRVDGLKVGHSSIVKTLDKGRKEHVYGAGTLRIENDVIIKVKNDSGHIKSTQDVFYNNMRETRLSTFGGKFTYVRLRR